METMTQKYQRKIKKNVAQKKIPVGAFCFRRDLKALYGCKAVGAWLKKPEPSFHCQDHVNATANSYQARPRHNPL